MPPYSGNAHKQHSHADFACGTTTFAGDDFDLADGNVSGGGDSSASSCTSGISTSSSLLKAEANLDLPAVSGFGGSFVVDSKWKMHFDLKLDMAGSTCSQSGQDASATLTFTLVVLNESSSKILTSKSKVIHHELTAAATAVDTYSTGFTQSATVVLDANDSYVVVIGLGFILSTDVLNPTSTAMESCSASAKITSTSGGILASSLSVKIS